MNRSFSRLVAVAATGLLIGVTACGVPTAEPEGRSVDIPPSSPPASSRAGTEAWTVAPSPKSDSLVAKKRPCPLPSKLRGKDFEAIPTSRRVIALTFDAGSIDKGADKILATLAKKNVPATFFLTGRFTKNYPKTAKKMARSHLSGNHTQTHPDLTRLSDAKVRAELKTARKNIIAATGVDPRPYFRFPYGEVDARRIKLVNQECYVSFRWTTDTLGWQGTSGGRSVKSVTSRVLKGAKPGGIVLMHVGTNPKDGSTLDADALPFIIDGLRAKGYKFVTLEAVW